MIPTRTRIVTPSRLHFGLLAWGEGVPRQFGSVGLMVDEPGIEIEARPSETWSASGHLADRTLAILRHVADSLTREGHSALTYHLTIERAPAEHLGLGTGTQLSLAVARLVLAATGEQDPTVARLAALTGRGLRSGIGLHGFAHGGLLVDGGRSSRTSIPPLLSRVEFPAEWAVLIVIPPIGLGLAGRGESEAFSRLPAVPPSRLDRVCRLVLLELLPAAVEHDLDTFGAALANLQVEVGRSFSPVQGGLFAHPYLEAVANEMRILGLRGVGQSSWGPALFGLAEVDPDRQRSITDSLRHRCNLEETSVFWTSASTTGSKIEMLPP